MAETNTTNHPAKLTTKIKEEPLADLYEKYNTVLIKQEPLDDDDNEITFEHCNISEIKQEPLVADNTTEKCELKPSRRDENINRSEDDFREKLNSNFLSKIQKNRLCVATNPRPEQQKLQTCKVLDLKIKNDDVSEEIIRLNNYLKTQRNCFFCDVCAKGYTTLSYLKYHKKKHSDPEYQCTECNKRYYCKKSFDSHMENHKGIIHACDKCEKTFLQVKLLRTHKLRMHTQTLPCDLCDRVFTQQINLTTHLNEHVGYRPYTCDTCNKSFYSEKSLKAHRITHSESTYACDRCDRKFNYFELLRKHKNIHNEIKAYPCTECEKSFITKRGLDKHRLSHMNDKL